MFQKKKSLISFVRNGSDIVLLLSLSKFAATNISVYTNATHIQSFWWDISGP